MTAINTLKTLTLAAAAAAFLTACQTGLNSLTPAAGTDSSSTNTASASWQLQSGSYNGNALAGGGITLRIEKGQLTGSTGVNTYHAAASAGSGRIKVGDIMTTRMAGTAAAMRLESDYLSALRDAERFEKTGGTLVIEGKNGSRLTFIPAADG